MQTIIHRSLAFLAFASFLIRPATAQRTQAPPTNSTGPASVELRTKDGVILHCEFYESKPSTQTVPVILIHKLKGQAGEWTATAKALQAAGFSVMVPNLRGHGESTEQSSPDGNAQKKLRADRLRGEDFQRMVTMDLEAVKKFLVKKHNNEELNIDMLTVVGSEFGATIGALWTAQDWSWPIVAGQKQGQDVKAVVLLSPKSSFKGMSIAPAIRSKPFSHISTFVVYGRDGKRGSDTRRIYKMIERAQVGQAKPRSFEWAIETNLQGAKLLQETKLGVADSIVKFIKAQVVARADEFPYKNRDATN